MRVSEMVAELRTAVIDCFEDIHRAGQVSPQTHARLKLVAGRTYGLVERVEALEAEIERLKAEEQATSELCRERSEEIARLTKERNDAADEADQLAAEIARLQQALRDAGGIRVEPKPIIIDPEEREKLRKLGKIP